MATKYPIAIIKTARRYLEELMTIKKELLTTVISGDTSALNLAMLPIFLAGWKKVGEIPYDFVRKRLSVVCENQGRGVLIAKGAVPQVLSVCDRVELPDGSLAPVSQFLPQLKAHFEEKGKQGFKTLALAYGEDEIAPAREVYQFQKKLNPAP